MKTIIKLVNLKKKFGDTCVTKGVNLDIPEGKMTVIIGRSGEGKSVLLKQIIGLIKPTEGDIFFNGVNITHLSEKEQEDALRVHLLDVAPRHHPTTRSLPSLV